MGCDGSVVKNLKQIKEAVLGLFIICVCSFQEDNCDNREIERISYLIILNIYAIKKKKKKWISRQLPRHPVKTSGKLKVNLEMISLSLYLKWLDYDKLPL